MNACEQVIYDYALSMVGKPYIWGGDDPIYGFDCSGLVNELLKACGMLPRVVDLNSQALFNTFKQANIPADQSVGFGTLAFYGINTRSISHVAFCLNDNLCLEAGSGNSTTTNKDIAAKQNAYVRIRPIKYRSDFLEFYTPHYSWRK